MRALMSSDLRAPSTDSEGITDGIDIATWTIHKDQKAVTYSVWDFAGQTIYYNTHQVHNCQCSMCCLSAIDCVWL